MSSSSARDGSSPPASKEEAVTGSSPDIIQDEEPSKSTSHRKKSNTGKSDPVKSKLASVLSLAFHTGSAFELIASATALQISACFPRFKDSRLCAGSVLTPSADTLQDLLSQAGAPATENLPRGIENAAPSAIRDTVLAGALIGSSEVLEGCLKNGACLTLCDSEGRHILHYLGATGNASLLRKVLRRLEKTHGTRGSSKQKAKTTESSFAELLNTQDKHGWTPLTIAIVRGNEEAVEAFLAYPELNLDSTMLTPGCAPSQPTQSGPLHLAAMGGRASLIFRLVERGCAIDQVDSLGRNIFHYGAALTHLEQSLQFLDAVAQSSKFTLESLAQEDNDGRTPLFGALANGNVGLSERLLFLLRQDATRNTPEFALQQILRRDKLGMTALHLAVIRGHCNILFRVGRLWTTYGGPGDDGSLSDNLVALYEGTEKQACLMDVVVGHLEPAWFWVDLIPSERVVVELIMSTTLHVSSLSNETLETVRHQLAKAVRACGCDQSLRAARMAVDLDKRGEQMMAGERRRTVLGVFWKVLEDSQQGKVDWLHLVAPKSEKFLAVPNLLSVRTAPGVNSSAPMPRQVQSANRLLRAPGFAGPRAGSGARSSSVSVSRPRKEATSPRVPPVANAPPLSPPVNSSRRGTLTRPPPVTTARGPSFAMPTKSVVMRGGRSERPASSTARTGSRTAPPQRGSSAALKSTRGKPIVLASQRSAQSPTDNLSHASSSENKPAPPSTSSKSADAPEEPEPQAKPSSMEEVCAC